VAYADVHGGKNVEKVKAELEKKAVSSLTSAAALPWQTLQDTHTEVGLLFWSEGWHGGNAVLAIQNTVDSGLFLGPVLRIYGILVRIRI
jgi:hypothetical protein